MKFQHPFLFTTVLLLAACGSESSSVQTPPAHDHSSHEEKQPDEVKTEEAKTDENNAPAVKPGDMTPLSPDAKLFFVTPPADSAVRSPILVAFGIEGAEVKPAGEAHPNSGHHHLIINGTTITEGQVVPANETHIHYGKGQKQAEVELAPGDYTLTMQFADHLHRSYGEKGSATIKITVVE
jgi:hypothetical protein